MRINSFFSKIILIIFVLFLTYLYAIYQHRKYYLAGKDSEVISFLKTIPDFDTININTGNVVNSINFFNDSNGVFVHVWGTWCGPCEKEMPDFLKYAESVRYKNIKFLLIAVNDEDVKIKKFMNRFVIPSNVTIVLDNKNIVMDLFGTLKVPESFLFDKHGKHVNKFIGPQEWLQESFKTRLDFWLSSDNLIDHKIETH